jgi:alpha-glucosidase
VEAQEDVPDSTLNLYRRALQARRKLQGAERLDWVQATASVLHFVRPGGWHIITNYGADPVELPDGELVVSSAPLVDGRLPCDTTAWLSV